MIHFIKKYLYHWDGLNQKLSQQLHLLINNEYIQNTLKFIAEYIGYYKMFPIHLIIIILIMLTKLLINKEKMSHKELKTKSTQYFQIIVTLVITILCMAATVGASKEIFSLTRPLCMKDFTLNEYAIEYKEILFKTKDMAHECYLSFPSGHSSYITAMLASLWKWLTKIFKILGIIIVAAVFMSRLALGMHFLSDVIFAMILSIFIAIAVNHVMYRFFTKRKSC